MRTERERIKRLATLLSISDDDATLDDAAKDYVASLLPGEEANTGDVDVAALEVRSVTLRRKHRFLLVDSFPSGGPS